MPRNLDAEARERSVVEAAWRVIVAEGMPALTVRRVAAEAGLAPSSMRYVLPTQAALRERAVGAVLERLRQRVAELPTGLAGEAWATAVLLELLPLDAQRRVEVEVWSALVTAAVRDEALQPLRAEADAVVRAVCARAAAAVGADLPVHADLTHALVDGLALHLVVRPPASDPSWALEVVRHHVHGLARRSAGPA